MCLINLKQISGAPHRNRTSACCISCTDSYGPGPCLSFALSYQDLSQRFHHHSLIFLIIIRPSDSFPSVPLTRLEKRREKRRGRGEVSRAKLQYPPTSLYVVARIQYKNVERFDEQVIKLKKFQFKRKPQCAYSTEV